MTVSTNQYPFLADGGEMGQLTRQFDWSQNSLGTPDQWPSSLRTTLGIVLHSAFPMFVFWGPDLICFYNDAYRASLGDNGKHPAEGKRGAEVWPEIWDFIGPLIDRVMNTGEPTFFKDQLVPFYRNGQIEDIYWTFIGLAICEKVAINHGGAITATSQPNRGATFSVYLPVS